MDDLEVSVPSFEASPFDKIKHQNEHGADYWSARELQAELGYTEWRNFLRAVKKARKSCENSGNTPDHHIVDANKEIAHGKGAIGSAEDFHLSRFGCYLIAQNGDPRKSQIAMAQKYFAIQARRQELTDQLAADRERLNERELVTESNRVLGGVAKRAGVQSKMFGIFHDAGYRGLYGGLGHAAIKRRKGIADSENLLDRIGTTELAANSFKATQTKEKLIKMEVRSQDEAFRVHEDVGREVRNAMKRTGGTMPEDLPAAEHIKQVERRIKSTEPKLVLGKKDAMGLHPAVPPQIDYDEL